jgi:NADPH:quinone reductase
VGRRDALRVVELPAPEAGPGQVRIRVHAAAVNPTDTLLRDGSRAERLRDVPAPHVPGMDAAGAVGGYAVQLGKADGLRVVADASPADEKLVTTLGADVVVPRGDDFGARVRAVLPGGADGLIDAALLDEQAISAVRDGGRIATVRGYEGPDQAERGITFHPVFVRFYAQEQAKLDRLRQQAESGQVTLRVARTFPADQAPEAHRILEAGGTRGRLILEF